jgi:MoxR-like ATPase
MTVTNRPRVGGPATNDEVHSMSDTLTPSRGRLAALGVYGFDDQEPIILAALTSGDPMLLIGRSGTGKTFLLNSISEALGLEHRHYNASLISFDDLVGFPYPDEAKSAVRFLETPATVWGAESVLIDEISRCKPEHQNRLFSLVHERRIQGLALTRLRYRWAAMNPCTIDQSAGEEYLGAEPLDPALADRFAVILEVGDWEALSDADRRLVANPAGEGVVADDGGRLKAELAQWQSAFAVELDHCPACIIDYVCAVTTALREGGIRLSPRRARLFTRTLLAATLVEGFAPDAIGSRAGEALFRKVLDASLPQRAWGATPEVEKVVAAHRLAWDATMLEGREQWLHHFHLQRPLDRKARLLLEACPDADTGTLAVEQLLANESRERAAAFALAAYPAAVEGRLPIGAEGVNDLGRFAQPLLTIDGEISWRERLSEKDTTHPELTAYAPVLSRLGAARRERAQQLFCFCILNNLTIGQPREFEQEFHRCVEVFRKGRIA